VALRGTTYGTADVYQYNVLALGFIPSKLNRKPLVRVSTYDVSVMSSERHWGWVTTWHPAGLGTLGKRRSHELGDCYCGYESSYI
jgi:hypothetical protein